jgi:hypothetical protein
LGDSNSQITLKIKFKLHKSLRELFKVEIEKLNLKFIFESEKKKENQKKQNTFKIKEQRWLRLTIQFQYLL